MNGRGIVFTGPFTLEFDAFGFDEDALAPTEVLIRTDRSLISPGSELSVLNDIATTAPTIYSATPGGSDFEGAAPWCPDGPYPARTGYANVGHVVARGRRARVGIGERVLTMTRHASVVRTDSDWFALALPDDLDDARAPFVRLAGVSMTALRVSSAGVGDAAVVLGLGLVGNFAAQLLAIAGCRVIAFDPSPGRREIAAACGITAFDPAQVDPVEFVRSRNGGANDEGAGAQIVIEATDRSEHVVSQAVALAGRMGEVVLLGTPRRPYAESLVEMVARVHWLGIKVIGAIEWQFPIGRRTPRARHTMEGNFLELIELIRQERLLVDPVLTHVLPASAAATAFSGLTSDVDHYLGVELDWSDRD